MLNKFCKKPLYEVTRTLARVAMGAQKAELVIRNARLVNVCTAEIQEGIDVAIAEGRIALVGDAAHCIGPETTVIDANGQYIAPGFMDGHIHVESSMISCGSMKMPVVPQGTTAFAYSPTEIMDDSTWICPSIKPGAMYWPLASMTFVSGPMQCDASPTSAMRPSAIATSMPSWISAVQTLTRRAFLMTVSAFCTPMATRAIVRVTSYNGFLQNLFSMLVPPSSLQVRKSGRCSCAGI